MKFDLNAKLILFISGSIFICSSFAADPPNRVIRTSFMSESISFSPAGENEWGTLTPNRPLYIGDRLWSPENSQTELQMDGSSFCMGGNTSLSVLNVDNNLVQVKVTEGRLNLFVRYIEPNQVYEVDTPNLAFTVRQPGYYQLDVSASEGSTMTSVQSGSAEVYGIENAYKIAEGKAFQFYDEDLKDFEAVEFAPDNFDSWCMKQATRGEGGKAERYVSKNIIGYEDLDRYGQWETVQDYGTVWIPSEVATEWVPYSDGEWSWIEPWGWTWVDNAPWGFAPYHYGRWTFVESRWFWVPGPLDLRAYYAPALVAFIGGEDFSIGLSIGDTPGIGWFPLGPSDVYIPAYFVSHQYFTNINLTNTGIIDRGMINNIYSHPRRADLRYQNLGITANAVTVVSRDVFRNAAPIRGNRIKLTSDQIRNAQVVVVPAIAPTQTSLVGATKTTRVPSKAIVDKQVIAKTKAPPRPSAFFTKQEQLSKQPGKPLERSSLMKKGEAVNATKDLKVVAPKAPTKEIPVTSRENKSQVRSPTPPSHAIPTREPSKISPREERSLIRPKERELTPREEKRLVPREERRQVAPPEEKRTVIPREERRAVTPSTQRPRMSPREERRTITPPSEQRPKITPREERRTITPPNEQRSIAPPQERRMVTPRQERPFSTPHEERRTITPQTVPSVPQPRSVPAPVQREMPRESLRQTPPSREMMAPVPSPAQRQTAPLLLRDRDNRDKEKH